MCSLELQLLRESGCPSAPSEMHTSVHCPKQGQFSERLVVGGGTVTRKMQLVTQSHGYHLL